jgi:hypothetical protein
MSGWVARLRQRVVAWGWERLNRVPVHTPNAMVTPEDMEEFAKFMVTPAGERIERYLLAQVNHECREAVRGGREWNCGFAQGCVAMTGKLLQLRGKIKPTRTPPVFSPNAPESTGETSGLDEKQLVHRLPSTYRS